MLGEDLTGCYRVTWTNFFKKGLTNSSFT